MTKRHYVFQAIIAVLLFIGINLFAKAVLNPYAVDLTQSQIYTLSDGTKDIVKSLDEPLTIRFFYSQEQANGLPVFQAYANRIQGLLQQIAQLSDNITLTLINPQAFTEEEDLAVSHGLQGVPVDNAGNKLYFGMSIENTTDDRGVMPFFDPARDAFLEYDIMRLLNEVAHPQRRKVGLLSTLPMRGSGSMTGGISGPWVIYNQLQEAFDVDVLQTTVTTIPDDLDVLMLVHPYGLSDKTLYAIDQYIIKGGKALIFLDSYSNVAQIPVKSSRLDKLLSHWGVSLVADKVAAEKAAAIQIQTSDAQSRLAAFPNVTWMELGAPYMSQESVITASLNKIRMIDSGFFTRSKDAQLRFEPLIQTTQSGAVVDVENIRDQRDTLALYRNYLPEGKNLILATQARGIITSAFEGDKRDGHVAKSPNPVHMVLVGDTDMLRDDYWVTAQNFFGTQLLTPSADNGAFVQNALEYLGGNEALIDLRTRGTEDRRFTVLDNLKQEAELSFRTEEERLKSELQSMETRLRELQSQPQEGAQLFTDAQTKEIKGFREAFLQTRKQLRAVQLKLNEHIERLGTRLALLNILLVPCLLLVLMFILPNYLRRRHASGKEHMS